ncbi:winged helix DNA-binding domain-containing protein [Actinomadura flavalba]|uniref:winged helix DNA-binding domain-containing protein n=1 Tax=Actinomadura flavalba TaxID=1120938 RepID=UPI0003A9011C|nr:winged helix DNA-binding domain-containing protein [Actinomadura flavalba]
MSAVTWGQVLAWRMGRQFLAGPEADSAGDVARRLCGVQAQVASSAALAVAVRRGRPSAGEVERALADGALVKTWAMRGTLHLLPVEEAGAYATLCAQVRNWEKPSFTKAFGASPADIEAMAEAAGEALAGGAALTREELTAAIVERTGSRHLAEVLGSGWGTLLKPLAWKGVLVYGPPQGQRVTFAAPSSLPGRRPVADEEDAARTVLRSFLGAHGPATPETFDRWLMRGMNRKRDVKRWFAALADETTEIEVDGTAMTVLSEHADAISAAPEAPEIRLLGPFDQYVLGAGTSATYLVPAEHRTAVSRPAGWISPVVLHRGRAAGVWETTDGEVTVTPFDDLPKEALADEIDRLRPLLDG